ncbi:MAG TPA: phosphoribosylformylglycinamidine cyclo-ligase, partial [Candidatus Cloacimonadota bacterium]|nr:phosphoribosylformylglycinamidine cyclo-ligase [Candidatus Cloacimonadota bacterium]
MDYKKSGVDIEAGENAVNRIKSLVRKTYNNNVLTELGSFGGLYQVDLSKWKEPVMVASTDGVGTKLIVAAMAGVYD